MCGYFCIGFIDVMLPGKALIIYTSLFYPFKVTKAANIYIYIYIYI